MKAARPPAFCASAMMCRARVVLPEDSGPKISTIRPRGTPPTPRAMSRGSAPVEIVSTFNPPMSPSVIRAPAPNSFSICVTAACSAWSRALASFSPASLKLGFWSAISLTSLSLVIVGGRKLQLGHRLVLRTGPAQVGLEEHQTSRTEEPEHMFGQRVGLGPDQGRLPALRRLGLHACHGQVRPEGALLRLVEPGFDQALLHPGLQGHGLLRACPECDQPRTLARRDPDRLGVQLH